MKILKKLPIIFMATIAMFLILTQSTQNLKHNPRILQEADQQQSSTEPSEIKEIAEKICKIASDNSGDNGIAGNKANFSKGTANKLQESGPVQDAIDGKKYLREYLYKETDSTDFIKDLLMDLLPLLILLVISLLGYLTYIACYFVDCYCPGLICCKKKTEERYSNYEMRWPIMGIIMFGLWVSIISIYGLVIGASYTDGYYMITCQLGTFISLFDEEIDGENWIGLTKIKTEMRVIDTQFETALNATFSSADVEDKHHNLFTSNNKLYNDQSDLYNIGYFSLYWGNNNPDTSQSTETYQIGQTVQGILLMTDEVKKGSEKGQSVAGISEATTSGIEQIEKFEKELLDFQKKLDKENDNIQDNIMPYMEYGVQIYFAITIGISILCIATSFLVAVLKLFKFRVLLHVSWCVFSLLMVVGFVLSTALYATTILGMQGCDIMDDIKADPKYLLDLDLFPESVTNRIMLCNNQMAWSGSGYLLDDYDITKDLEKLEQLETDIQEIEANRAKVEDGTLTATLNGQLDTSKNGFDGVLTTGAYQDSTPQTIYASTDTTTALNTNSGCCAGGGFVGTNDLLKNVNGCADNFADTLSDTTANNICIKSYSSGQLDQVTHSGYDNCKLPGTIPTGCDAHDAFLRINQYQDLMNLKKQQLEDTRQANVDYQASVDNWYSNLGSFSTDNSEVFSKPNTLIKEGTQCLFVGQNLYDIMDTFCDNIIPDVYSLTITMIVHAVGMLFGSLFLYCAGYRYANVISKEKFRQKQRQGKYQK